MVRLILGVFLLYIAIRIVGRLSEILKMPIEPTSFGVGLVAALVVAFVLFQIDSWWSTITRPGQAQQVKLKTTETPNQISRASCVALVIGVAVAVVAGVGIFKFLYP